MAAARDAKTVGAAFLNEILGKLPAELQAKAKDVFADAAAAPALEIAGGGALRQGEFSTLMNELQEKQAENDAFKAQLDTWFTTRQADLVELKDWREGKRSVANPNPPNPNPNPQPPAIDPTKIVTPETLQARMDEQERGAVGFFVELQDLALEHYQTFGERLNTRELLAHKDVQKVGIRGVYQEVHKEQITARQTKMTQDREAALRAEGAAAERARLASTQNPFPVTGNETTSLDGIEAARAGHAPKLANVDDMASEYARLGQQRAGSPV